MSLHARGAVSPFVGWVQKVDLPRDHVDGFVRARLPQLSEHGVLDIASHLRIAPGVILAGQAHLQRSHRQIVMTLVGRPVPAAAPDDHGHMSQPFRKFVFEKMLSPV